MPDSSLDAGFHWFMAVFIAACVFIAGTFAFTVYAIIRRRSALRAAGFDPLTADVQLVSKLANSRMLAPAASLESRLAELDALRAKGAITEEEHRAARAKALGS